MKTMTVVELTRTDIDNALIAAARSQANPTGGGSVVEFTLAKDGTAVESARVTFTWGAKPPT